MSGKTKRERNTDSAFFVRLSLCLALWFASAGASAQATDAAQLLSKAQKVAAEAEAQYAGTILNIDQPLWRQAINLGEQALAAAPNNPDTVLFLAKTYSRIGWYVRAWPRWQTYLESETTLQPDDAATFAKTGTELGFSRYSAGDLAGALPYYLKVADVQPENAEALSWLGRLSLEQGDPATALPYWQRAVAVDPGNQGFAFYRDLSAEQIRVGVSASNAFRSGLSAYDAGNLETALADFEAAAAANDQFKEALTWAGRTSGELEQWDKAERYWNKVLALAPDDASAKYFLQLVQDQKQWGAAAASAFYEGQKFYDQGDLKAAAERFDAAARFNPAYKDALVWRARSFQELGEGAKAVEAWRGVLKLDPADKRATYFLSLAEQQLTYGSEAGRAFVQGVAQFEVADLGAAETSFQTAVDANPKFAEAWAWLGRSRFTQADYAAAAAAYTKAADLEPSNDDYRFFADEAAYLSGDDTSSGN